jgi:hypothetical protein
MARFGTSYLSCMSYEKIYSMFSHLMKYLVSGFNHLEKYEFANGKDYPIYEQHFGTHCHAMD